jgi:hypothetical protein
MACADQLEGSRIITAESNSTAMESGADPDVVARVNIALVKESAKALLKLQKDTGLKKVDIVNRAIQLYEFIASELKEDRQVVVRGDDGHEVLVKIFM